MKSVRTAAATSVAVMALVGLSACGGNSDSSKGSDTSSSASSGSSASTSASSDSSGAASSGSGSSAPAAGSDVSAADLASLFKAAFSKATSAHIAVTSTGSTGITAEGDADYSKPAKIQMQTTLPQIGEAELLLVDNVVYIKTKLLGDKYLKVDLASANNPVGPLLSSGLDPSTFVDSIAGAITKATFVGPETVDGDQLDHYTVTVDSAKLLSSVSSALPSGASGVPSAPASSSLPPTLTYQMYFDKSGYFRQFAVDLGGTTGSFTAKFSDWGTPVNISAPPASQVTEVPLPDVPGAPSQSAAAG